MYEYTLYRAKKEGNGLAVRISVDEGKVFVNLARQAGKKDGNDTFDWVDENKKPRCCVSLGLSDIGALLALFDGKQKEVKLYHEFERAGQKIVTQITASPYVKDGVDKGYSLGVYRGEQKFSLGVSHAEAQIIKILLQESIFSLTKWVPKEKK